MANIGLRDIKQQNGQYLEWKLERERERKETLFT